MSVNDYIADVTANLTEWGIDYRETTEGVSVGSIHLEIAEDTTYWAMSDVAAAVLYAIS